jgi:hypothetical protein
LAAQNCKKIQSFEIDGMGFVVLMSTSSLMYEVDGNQLVLVQPILVDSSSAWKHVFLNGKYFSVAAGFYNMTVLLWKWIDFGYEVLLSIDQSNILFKDVFTCSLASKERLYIISTDSNNILLHVFNVTDNTFQLQQTMAFLNIGEIKLYQEFEVTKLFAWDPVNTRVSIYIFELSSEKFLLPSADLPLSSWDTQLVHKAFLYSSQTTGKPLIHSAQSTSIIHGCKKQGSYSAESSVCRCII